MLVLVIAQASSLVCPYPQYVQVFPVKPLLSNEVKDLLAGQFSKLNLEQIKTPTEGRVYNIRASNLYTAGPYQVLSSEVSFWQDVVNFTLDFSIEYKAKSRTTESNETAWVLAKPQFVKGIVVEEGKGHVLSCRHLEWVVDSIKGFSNNIKYNATVLIQFEENVLRGKLHDNLNSTLLGLKSFVDAKLSQVIHSLAPLYQYSYAGINFNISRGPVHNYIAEDLYALGYEGALPGSTGCSEVRKQQLQKPENTDSFFTYGFIQNMLDYALSQQYLQDLVLTKGSWPLKTFSYSSFQLSYFAPSLLPMLKKGESVSVGCKAKPGFNLTAGNSSGFNIFIGWQCAVTSDISKDKLVGFSLVANYTVALSQIQEQLSVSLIGAEVLNYEFEKEPALVEDEQLALQYIREGLRKSAGAQVLGTGYAQPLRNHVVAWANDVGVRLSDSPTFFTLR